MFLQDPTQRNSWSVVWNLPAWTHTCTWPSHSCASWVGRSAQEMWAMLKTRITHCAHKCLLIIFQLTPIGGSEWSSPRLSLSTKEWGWTLNPSDFEQLVLTAEVLALLLSLLLPRPWEHQEPTVGTYWQMPSAWAANGVQSHHFSLSNNYGVKRHLCSVYFSSLYHV